MSRSLLFFLCMISSVQTGIAAEPSQQLERLGEFRVVHPEELAARINHLFDGTKVPHPAAALSAWKRASRGKGHLGKPLEAAIAMFNPEMAREWRSVDGAKLTAWAATSAAGAKSIDWSIVVPKDDGSLAAFLTAARLTGGQSESELAKPNPISVDRLGPPGSPVAARMGRTHIIAGSRLSLDRALDDLNAVVNPPVSSETPGVHFQIEGRLFSSLPPGTPASRAVAELGRAVDGRGIEGFATLEGDTARIRFRSHSGTSEVSPLLRARTIEPGWLEWIPQSSAMVATALRFDPSPPTWNSLFRLLDRIEKSDPAKVEMFPIRMRMNLMLGAALVQPEIDLWPHLNGTTACIIGDNVRNGVISCVLLALHLDDEPAARNLRDALAPRIFETYVLKSAVASKKAAPAPIKPDVGTAIGRLGEVEKRPLLIARRGQTVLLGWGSEDLFSECLSPRPNDERGKVLVEPKELASSRLTLLWPGRLGFKIAGIDPSSDSGQVLSNSAPIVWTGGTNPEMTQIDDQIAWRGLQSLAKAFLETVPLDVSGK